MTVVVLADPRDRVLAVHAAKLSDARQGSAGTTDASRACNLDSPALNGEAMGLLERRPCVVEAERKPEVWPAKPSTAPRQVTRPLAEEVQRPLGARHRWVNRAQAATAKARAVGQLDNPRSTLPWHGLMLSGAATGTRSSARRFH
jgi:hypothetical protein